MRQNVGGKALVRNSDTNKTYTSNNKITQATGKQMRRKERQKGKRFCKEFRAEKKKKAQTTVQR